jgi:pimeloyl-ACP methyl ester carboxylesterase
VDLDPVRQSQAAENLGPDWDVDRGGHLWPKDREAVTEDGVRVRYTVRGPEDAPAVVLCAGYLCPDNFWWFLAPVLAEHHRVVMLNYRSVGASTHPREPGWFGRNLRAMDYAVNRVAGDVITVVEKEGIEEATYLGHSMGCQVALAVYDQLGPERVTSLVLVTGPFASPLSTFYDTDVGERIWPYFYLFGKTVPEPVWRLVPKLGYIPGMLDVAELIRAIGPFTPREPMQVYVDHFRRLDAGVGLRYAQAMHRYDASHVLDEVVVPALVIVGEKDTFTPPHIGDEFCERIGDDCELLKVEDGTHCALLEFPALINNTVLDFLERRQA